jgi:hypothetical protein
VHIGEYQGKIHASLRYHSLVNEWEIAEKGDRDD